MISFFISVNFWSLIVIGCIIGTCYAIYYFCFKKPEESVKLVSNERIFLHARGKIIALDHKDEYDSFSVKWKIMFTPEELFQLNLSNRLSYTCILEEEYNPDFYANYEKIFNSHEYVNIIVIGYRSNNEEFGIESVSVDF